MDKVSCRIDNPTGEAVPADKVPKEPKSNPAADNATKGQNMINPATDKEKARGLVSAAYVTIGEMLVSGANQDKAAEAKSYLRAAFDLLDTK